MEQFNWIVRGVWLTYNGFVRQDGRRTMTTKMMMPWILFFSFFFSFFLGVDFLDLVRFSLGMRGKERWGRQWWRSSTCSLDLEGERERGLPKAGSDSISTELLIDCPSIQLRQHWWWWWWDGMAIDFMGAAFSSSMASPFQGDEDDDDDIKWGLARGRDPPTNSMVL